MKQLIEKLVRMVRWIISLRIPVYAAHAGYFMILAAFPMLVLLLGLLRYTGLQVQTLTGVLEGFLPQALLPAARKLIRSTYENTSGAVISLSAVTALWSAGRGIYGLLTGLNGVYGVTENRGWLRTRLLCGLYALGFLLVLVLTLVLQVFGTALFHAYLGSKLLQLRFFLLLLLQTGLFAAIFTVLPNRKNRFRESLPGAFLSAAGWLIFSDLYSIYVEHFAGYANVFGSVYGVALSMLWLYWCMCILFYGGALNRYLTI